MSTNSLSVNCTNVDDLVKRYYLPVTYGAIFVVGVMGDLTALVVYVAKVRPWTNTTIIMVNLLITDLLLMVSMPFLIYYYTLDDSWTPGIVMCRFTRFIFHLNLYGSILFLTCLAVFRYVAVARPSHRENIKKKRWGAFACALLWIVAVALITPIFNKFELELDKTNNKTTCPDLASSKLEFVRRYSWALTTLGYLCPLVVVCLCYRHIMRVLRTGPHTGRTKRTKARRVIVLILVCFIFCFLPFHVLRALRIYTRNTGCMLKRGAHAAYVISRPFAVLNVIFNLLLYTLSGGCFQQAFVELFRCEQFVAKTKKILEVAVISKPTADVQ